MRALLIVPALFALAMPLGAEDMTLGDLRLTGGILSNDFSGSSSTTVTDSGGNVVSTTDSGSGGRDADSNYRGSLGLMFGHLGPAGGFIYGADVAVNHATFDNGGNDAHATSAVVDVQLGYGLAVTPFWHFELAGLAGIGRTYYSVSDNGSSSTSKDWHKYVEYGGKLGTYWSLPSHLQLGIEALYLVGRFDPDYSHDDGSGNTVSVSDNRRNHGFGLQAVVGVRF